MRVVYLMSDHQHRRVFKTPLRNTEAEADADALKLVVVLMAHAPELLPEGLEPVLMPPDPGPKLRPPPGAAALRKTQIA